MRKIKVLLTVLCVCLFVGAFSACNLGVFFPKDSSLSNQSSTEQSTDVANDSLDGESATDSTLDSATDSTLDSASDSVGGDADVHTHVWDEGMVKEPPTCEREGEATYSCECGATKTEPVPALGHNYDDGVVTTEPTCTEKGVKTFTCANGCDGYTEDIDALGHIYTQGVCWCGDLHTKGLEYTLNDDGVSYSVTGIGTCTDTDIIIPSTYKDLPVTSIGEYAFRYCYSLTSIEIPDSVTSIGDGAFYWCDSLTSVEIPDSVTSIGSYAFYGCRSLTSIEIPNSVTSIGDGAFYGCTSLTSIEIPDSVTSIGDDAFGGCYKLVEVYNKSSLDITKGSSFNGWVGYYAKNVYTPTEGESKLSTTEDGYILYTDEGVVSLIGYVGTETDLVLPENVTEIYQYAFYNCDSLTSVVIGDSVTSIGENAFKDCTALTSIEIPDSVTSIGRAAFYGCDSLTSIEIPDSVTSIGRAAFYGCTSLTSVEIPDSVTSIGDYAFEYCDSLTSVYYKGTIEEWNSISIESSNEKLTNATRYYYSETEASGCWHYVDGVPTLW